MSIKSVLVTGAAGFIGSNVCRLLLDSGHQVVGVDNMNDYYDVRIKEFRLTELNGYPRFYFYRVDIEEYRPLEDIFENHIFDEVINLAARAGVRWSLVDPFVYVRTNVLGTANLLELSRKHNVSRFLLASTSSLYAGQKMPFSEVLPVNEPISPYAASKKGAESMCYAFHHNYGLNVAVVRYFTVYGPAGRPDMSYFRFIKQIAEDTPIEIYGDGLQSRDFTFVTDIARGTVMAVESIKGFEIINLGGSKPYTLNRMLELIEENLGKKAEIIYKPFHKADMKDTWAEVNKAEQILGWKAEVSLKEGLKQAVKWYQDNQSWVKNISI